MASKSLSTSTKVIIGLVLAALLAVIALLYTNTSRRAEKNAITTIEQERQQWQKKVERLEEKLAGNTLSETTATSQPEFSSQSTSEAPKEYQPGDSAVGPEDICTNTIKRLNHFFHYLDKQEYIKQFGFKNGSKIFFSTILKKLYSHEPQVVREKDSLLTIMQNSAHLFRVLGKRDLNILKTIMEAEADTLEPVFATFYEGIKESDQCLEGKYPVTLPINQLYTYSAFVLNTLGGQAYLFRREPVIRILVKYYALRIVHDANELNLNTAGIDIRPGIKSMIDELLVISALKDREHYLNTMLVLQAQYDEQYGDG
jgi:hypothetical protein